MENLNKALSNLQDLIRNFELSGIEVSGLREVESQLIEGIKSQTNNHISVLPSNEEIERQAEKMCNSQKSDVRYTEMKLIAKGAKWLKSQTIHIPRELTEEDFVKIFGHQETFDTYSKAWFTQANYAAIINHFTNKNNKG